MSLMLWLSVLCLVIQGLLRRSIEKKFFKEEINGVNVLRIPVPEFDKSSKISRIKNLLVYFGGAKKATKEVCSQDYVFAILQPPIMGGMLGVYGKKKLKAKLIYCIQDFNVYPSKSVGYFWVWAEGHYHAA